MTNWWIGPAVAYGIAGFLTGGGFGLLAGYLAGRRGR